MRYALNSGYRLSSILNLYGLFLRSKLDGVILGILEIHQSKLVFVQVHGFMEYAASIHEIHALCANHILSQP
jgi:hypothetical protein